MIVGSARVISTGDNMLVVAGTTCAAMGTNMGLSTEAIMCSPTRVENWGQRALTVFRAGTGAKVVHPQFTGLITSIIDLSPIRPGQYAGSRTKQDVREISL